MLTFVQTFAFLNRLCISVHVWYLCAFSLERFCLFMEAMFLDVTDRISAHIVCERIRYYTRTNKYTICIIDQHFQTCKCWPMRNRWWNGGVFAPQGQVIHSLITQLVRIKPKNPKISLIFSVFKWNGICFNVMRISLIIHNSRYSENFPFISFRTSRGQPATNFVMNNDQFRGHTLVSDVHRMVEQGAKIPPTSFFSCRWKYHPINPIKYSSTDSWFATKEFFLEDLNVK